MIRNQLITHVTQYGLKVGRTEVRRHLNPRRRVSQMRTRTSVRLSLRNIQPENIDETSPISETYFKLNAIGSMGGHEDDYVGRTKRR